MLGAQKPSLTKQEYFDTVSVNFAFPAISRENRAKFHR